MSVTKGRDGRFKVGSATVAEVRSFSFTRNAARADRSTIDDTWDRSAEITKNWSGQAQVWWDPTDASGQGGLEEGEEAVANLYPQGTANGAVYYTGNVIVDSVEITVNRENHVEATIQFTGNGVCTRATVGA